MHRLLVASVLLVFWTGHLAAQAKPDAAPVKQSNDPYERRALRERAVTHLDTEAARGFVETLYGDEACLAVFACSLPVARKLAEFHASGKLDKLPRTRQLLRVIGQHGDDVAEFVLLHANELEEPASMDAFLDHPLEIALRLKPLDVAAGEIRARRQYVPPRARIGDEWHALGIVVGMGVITALVIWRIRRARTACL